MLLRASWPSQEWMGSVRAGLSPATGWLRRPIALCWSHDTSQTLWALVWSHFPVPLASCLPPTPLVMVHFAFIHAHIVYTHFHSQVYMLVHMHTHAQHPYHMPPLPFSVLGTLLCFSSVIGLPML